MNNDVEQQFRAVLADVFKCYKKGKGIIAAELSDRLGLTGKERITLSRLESFTRAASKGHIARFPAVWLPVLYEITQDDRLLRALLPEHLRQRLTLGELVEIKVRKSRSGKGRSQ